MTRSPSTIRVASRYRLASLCSTKVSTAWISPRGKVVPVQGSHGEWAVKHLVRGGRGGDIDFDPEDDSYRHMMDTEEEATSMLLDEGWVRVSNWKEMEAWRAPHAAMESAARLVMDCVFDLGTIDPEQTTVFLWKKHNRKEVDTVADFIAQWGGRAMVDNLFEGLLEAA